MTIEQIQCLLRYLGWDAGPVDGLFGPKTQGAVQAFQKAEGLDVDGVPGVLTQQALLRAVARGDGQEAGGWAGVRYFTRREFACKCGQCGGFPAEPDGTLVAAADRVREHFGLPVVVSSGVRCTIHNRNVGGVGNSRHLTGKAMDFRVGNLPAARVLDYVQSLGKIRYAYAIDGQYVHMDVA